MIKRITIFVVIALISSWWCTTTVMAQTVVFSDDFSNGLEKWQPIRDNGSYWSVVDGQAQAVIPFGSTISELIPKDHYWDTLWQDYEYEFDYTPIAGVDRNISFSVQDLCNWYEAHFVEEVLNFVRVRNCLVPISSSNNYVLENGRTHHFKISFIEGHIKLYINDALVLDQLDWLFEDNYGRIALKAGTGAAAPTIVLYDNVVVRVFGLPKENVDILKQTDPLWANAEYDSALEWATNPTIGSWGCALTSLAMIFNYHGLVTFPDGTPLNPLTLNQWLISQADGYLGNGMLNWVAAMRLTQLISNVYQTPKLEYQRIPGADLNTAVTQIDQHLPVVLQIDGHFLVGDGVANDLSDIAIKDPAYSYDLLSQHSVPLLSTRTFTPSQTDLSYFVVAFDPIVNAELSLDTEVPTQFIGTTETIRDFVDQGAETKLTTILVPKPVAGTYTLTISRPVLSHYEVAIFAYDQEGTPTELSISGWAGPTPQSFQLDYSPGEIPPFLTATTSWENVHQIIHETKESQGFDCWNIYWLLDLTVTWAEKNPGLHTEEAIRWMALELSAYRNWITPDRYRYLQQELNKLRRQG